MRARLVATLSTAVLLLSAPGAAQDLTVERDSTQAATPNGDIVVTARSLAATAADLAACLARGSACPPDEDVRLTLAHAENQFVTGNYRNARATMLASLRRNRQHRTEFPVEVSDLLRANGRVAAHLGEARAYQLSVLDMRDTLRDALPENDPRVLAAQIEVADSRARLGYVREARDAYGDIAARASALSLPRVAAFATIRRAMIDLPKERAERVPARVRDAVASLTDIVDKGSIVGADLALLAEVALARVEREDGNLARTEALVRRFGGGQGTTRPLLISSSPVDLPTRDNTANMSSRLSQTGVDNRWIDVGFWINANGRITDYEVLRRSAGGTGPWTDAIERSINSRVYAPLRSTDGLPSQGFYIIERYTLTSDFADSTDCTGSRLRCRNGTLRVERIDLTPDDFSNTPTRPAEATTP